MNTPENLKMDLIKLFPILDVEYQDDDPAALGYEPPLTFHSVWHVFSYMAADCLKDANIKTLKHLADIINYMVESGGEKENAVTTCFLEHASQNQAGISLRPYLSNSAKNELR